jgi:3-polyprenyl-4-hydroxybenzoate decarboxylase
MQLQQLRLMELLQELHRQPHVRVSCQQQWLVHKQQQEQHHQKQQQQQQSNNRYKCSMMQQQQQQDATEARRWLAQRWVAACSMRVLHTLQQQT